MTPRIAVVGAGNVATHLACALHHAGACIVQVCARTHEHARALAARVGAEAVVNPAEINPHVDFCLVSATDSATPAIASVLPRIEGVVAHTSGSVPMTALLPASDRVGVMYPLQTFSKGRAVDLRKVPFFNEGSDVDTLARIDGLASMISASVYHADSDSRRFLHVAGVLGCNFPNYLLSCAAEVLARGGYGLEVIRPLLEETVAKAFEFGPDAAQTGPARRGDVSTIDSHCSMLPDEQALVYRVLSEAIMRKYHICHE